MNRCSFPAILRSVLLTMISLAPFAAAQTPKSPSLITQKVDNAARVTLSGSVPRAVKTAKDIGELDGSQSLQRMLLVLKPSEQQQASLKRLLDSQQNKTSQNYHKWLTPAQFAASYGPSDEDLAAVRGWLESQGLKVTSVGNGRRWIEFSGSAQQVSSAFQTSLHSFEANGERHIANATEISVPQAITPVVSGVLSLNNFRKQPTSLKPVAVKRTDDGKLLPVDPTWTTRDQNLNPYYYVAPTDAQKIYNASPLLKDGVDGTGVSIAIPGRTNIYLSDIQSFRQIFGLKQNDPNIIVNGPDPGYLNNDLGESTLDIEWASALAPGATINFVESASTDTTDGIDLSSAYIVDNALAPIVSLSYGECEGLLGPSGNQFYSSLWQQAAAEGITAFVSTGDNGAAQCDGDLQRNNLEPNGPALNGPTISGLSSTPYNVAVGGTQFNEGTSFGQYWSPNNDSMFGSAYGYIPEQAWNESCDPTLPMAGTNCFYGQTYYILEGAGGGPSNCSQSTVDKDGNVTCTAGYAKPSWQTGLGVTTDGVRDTPDLSLNASPDDDGYLLCAIGSCQTTTLNGQTVITNASIVGGTSVSTPAMAGIMALIEQKNGVNQGQADYIFYKLAAMDDRSACDSSKMTDPTAATACNFNDVTMGSNSVPGLPGYGTTTAEWSAGAGYDLATGLGSVNAANFAANWSKVTFLGSSTALTATGGTVGHGEPLTVNVAVTAAAGGTAKPSGEIVLMTDKYGAAGQVMLDSTGKFSGPITTLPGGSYSLTAQYGGDGTFGGSTSAPVSITVAPEDSLTTVQLFTLDNSGRPVLVTAPPEFASTLYVKVTVAGKSGQGHPTGTVNVFRSGVVVLSSPLATDGTAFIQTGNNTPYIFPGGNSDITAQYSGDNSFHASTSAVAHVTFAKQTVHSLVQISSYNVPAGQPVFLGAGLQSYGTPSPTGTFQFFDNGVALSGLIPVVESGAFGTGPQAFYTATVSTPGDHYITVQYSGDANYANVNANDTNLAWGSDFVVGKITGAATTTSVIQTPTSVTFGESFNFIVTVKPVKPGGAVPTGEVWVTSNGIVFGIGELVNGQATIFQQVGAGTAQVYAQYHGDSNYAPSTSPIFTVTVAKRNPVVSLTASNYVLAGTQTSLNFVVRGYNYDQSSSYGPQGFVQFFSAVNGGAPQAVTGQVLLVGVNPIPNAGFSARVTLPTGTNVITAQYTGDSYFNPATTAPVTVVVSPPDFAVSSNPAALTVSAGGSTTATLSVAPILGFSGAVSLSCSGGLPSGTSCSFAPATVDGSSGQSTLTVTMQGPFTVTAINRLPGWWTLSGGSAALAVFLIGFAGRRSKYLAAPFLSLALFGVMMGCGGSSKPATSSVVVQTSQAKVASGTSVTFTADITGGKDGETGSVTFYDGTTALGTAVDVSSGRASMDISSLSVGTHAITAMYTGDKSHVGSTSLPVYEAITGTTQLQVTASSGSLSHVVSLNLVVQ
jgi:hypothetical protein